MWTGILPHALACLSLVLIVHANSIDQSIKSRTGSFYCMSYKSLFLSSVLSDFRVQTDSRCSGHYRTTSWKDSTFSHCEDQCRLDSKCASYSQEMTASKTCYLYDSRASCITIPGWISGHKDTRCGQVDDNDAIVLRCPAGTIIDKVIFASFGTPSGSCGSYRLGSCHLNATYDVIEDICLGENSCTVSANARVLGDPCPFLAKNLRVQVSCTGM